MPMTDRKALIMLNMISGVGYVKYGALVDFFGSPSAVFGASEAELSEVRGIGGGLAARIASFAADDLETELDYVDRGGARLITLLDDNYPAALRNIYDPPLCLYVRGVLPELGDKALAVVGSRNCSEYGRRMARTLAADAACGGYTVVSGLAFGIDAAAHESVVEAGGRTVAVLGGGLARIHPQEHVPLARRIVETEGAIVSEFPMTFPVSRTSFPRRNRIVSGMCCATLVVECGLRSGALITANAALEQGREVFAVPGRADNPNAKGCHMLIRNGATLVEDFFQVCESLQSGLAPASVAPEDREQFDFGAVTDLEEPERRIVELIREGCDTADKLLEHGSEPAGSLLGRLMSLEMRMVIRRNADGTFELR